MSGKTKPDGATATQTTLRRRAARAAKIARSLAKCAKGKVKPAATAQRAANRAWATDLKVARGEFR